MANHTSATALLDVADRLTATLAPLRFGAPVTHVYNPLAYARDNYARYLGWLGDEPLRAVFIGMNPGPWGMTQTGVPFGEVGMVRDWLGIDGAVGKPTTEHPARPVTGLACTRSEVSGKRLWGAIADHFGTPEAFFARYAVLNYCPLVFLEASGKNRTPDQLPAHERAPLTAACDAALREAVLILRPTWVIGVGHWAEARARTALDGLDLRFGRVPHPSPASPAANRGWAAAAAQALEEQGLCPL